MVNVVAKGKVYDDERARRRGVFTYKWNSKLEPLKTTLVDGCPGHQEGGARIQQTKNKSKPKGESLRGNTSSL